jgi:hypothetical protein
MLVAPNHHSAFATKVMNPEKRHMSKAAVAMKKEKDLEELLRPAAERRRRRMETFTASRYPYPIPPSIAFGILLHFRPRLLPLLMVRSAVMRIGWVSTDAVKKKEEEQQQGLFQGRQSTWL